MRNALHHCLHNTSDGSLCSIHTAHSLLPQGFSLLKTRPALWTSFFLSTGKPQQVAGGKALSDPWSCSSGCKTDVTERDHTLRDHSPLAPGHEAPSVLWVRLIPVYSLWDYDLTEMGWTWIAIGHKAVWEQNRLFLLRRFLNMSMIALWTWRPKMCSWRTKGTRNVFWLSG